MNDEKEPVFSIAKVQMSIETMEEIVSIAEQLRDVCGLFGIHEAAISKPEPSTTHPGYLTVDLLLSGSEKSVQAVLKQLQKHVANEDAAAIDLENANKIANDALAKRDAKRNARAVYPNCDVCNKPFTEREWEDRHNPHDEGCVGIFNPDGCSCDNNTHDRCCWDCHPPKETK